MKVISPTVGRKVWYWPVPTDGMVVIPKEGETAQPCDATVVYVHNDREVNLLVRDHEGTAYRRHNVNLVQPDQDNVATGFGYCVWMPYQVGQAQKAAEEKPSKKKTDPRAEADPKPPAVSEADAAVGGMVGKPGDDQNKSA